MKSFQGNDPPFEPADPRHFVGSARVKRFPLVDGAQPVIVYLVEFEAGGRTNWHTHTGPQLLLVKEGRGIVQKWGDSPRAIEAGHPAPPEPATKPTPGAPA